MIKFGSYWENKSNIKEEADPEIIMNKVEKTPENSDEEEDLQNEDRMVKSSKKDELEDEGK